MFKSDVKTILKDTNYKIFQMKKYYDISLISSNLEETRLELCNISKDLSGAINN